MKSFPPSLIKVVLTLWAFLGLSVSAYAKEKPRDLSYLRALQVEHPYCQGKANLDVARDYFVEVANALPGVQEYNELVREYRRKRWDAYREKHTQFLQLYPQSPLREALAFLDVQVMFEHADEQVGPPNMANAEKAFREVLVQHPESELAPVLYATAGNYWLQRGLTSKSLELYERAREKYPLHSASCVILMGIAENRYLEGELERAQPTFKLVLQKCTNPMLQLGAAIRLADLELKSKPALSEKAYEQALKKDPNRFNRFYQHALFNLGEIKFRRKNYDSAHFYFDEYVKHSSQQAVCLPYAQKRVADIAFVQKEPIKKVVGLYMVAHDQAPGTDAGRFAYLRGLMLEMPKFGDAEFQRRLKVIDENIDQLEDSDLRKEAYVEKGLVLLDRGEVRAIEYLRRLGERGDFLYDPLAVRSFVRKRINDLLQKDADLIQADKESVLKDEAKNHLLRQVEKVYSKWIKGSPEDKNARRFFTEGVLVRFQKNIVEDPAEATKQLAQWALSPIWDPKAASSVKRNQTSEALLRKLSQSRDSELALIYSKNKPLLDPFAQGPYQVLWLAVAQSLKDQKWLNQIAQNNQAVRSPASIHRMADGEVENYSHLMLGRVFREQKKYAQADIALRSIEKGAFLTEALKERLAMYRATQRYFEAYDTAMRLYHRAAKSDLERVQTLATLHDLTQTGKLWKKIPELIQLVEADPRAETQKASIYHLAGQSYYPANCGQATEMFEKAIASGQEFVGKGEAQYKLGKCLVTLKKPAQAKQVWEELANINDPFWTPLAKNELNILSQ